MQSTLIKNQRETSSHFDRLVGFKSTHNNCGLWSKKERWRKFQFQLNKFAAIVCQQPLSPWWNINAAKKKNKCLNPCRHCDSFVESCMAFFMRQQHSSTIEHCSHLIQCSLLSGRQWNWPLNDTGGIVWIYAAREQERKESQRALYNFQPHFRKKSNLSIYFFDEKPQRSQIVDSFGATPRTPFNEWSSSAYMCRSEWVSHAQCKNVHQSSRLGTSTLNCDNLSSSLLSFFTTFLAGSFFSRVFLPFSLCFMCQLT